MEGTLRELLVDSAGGPNRARILRALDERPRNTNQLSDALDLHYKTVRRHLDVLADSGLVRKGGEGYGAVFLPTERLRTDREIVEVALAAASA